MTYETVEWGVVLIETLWNVKQDSGIAPLQSVHVLIETLWNVKIENHPQISRGTLY